MCMQQQHNMAVHSLIVVLLISVSMSQAHESFDKFLELSGNVLSSNIGYEEKQLYYQVWKDNTQYIEEHNAMDEVTFKLGINKFTHLLPHQLPKSAPWTPKTNNDADSFKTLRFLPTAAPPTEVDWRIKGDVSAVHNQGQSDCSFEIVFADVVTSFHAIQTGRLIPFSPQQLIDCCTEDCRCNRLLEPGQLATCIKKHGGLCPDYSNKTECECQKCNEDQFMIRGMREVPSGNETALQYAVAIEPVMVAVDASHRSFQLYRSGIYKEPLCSSTMLDHFMLVVGYGNDDGMDYWLCKNSWGAAWGMNGYIKIARYANNMCGVATTAYYPY